MATFSSEHNINTGGKSILFSYQGTNQLVNYILTLAKHYIYKTKCFIYLLRQFVVCLTLCHFDLVFFSPFSIAITPLGEERAHLSAFRTFDRFVLVWICQFPLPFDVWEGLRFVILALSGLLSFSANEIDVNIFMVILKEKFRCEKYIAYLNNKLAKFLSKWGPLHNTFS